jgi:hypothetical protein
MPGLGRLNVLGAGYRVRRGTILAGLSAVRGGPVAVLLYVAAVRIGEHLVQLCGPVMGAGRMKAHHRGALEGFLRPYARHRGRRPRLRDVVRSRASRSASLEVGRAEAGRQLGIPFVQIADPRVEFNRSPRPAGRALARPVSAVHLLVVSQPGVFHKGHGRLTGPRRVWGGGSAPRAVSAPGRPGGHQTAALHAPAPDISLGWEHEPGAQSRRLVRQPSPKDNARALRSSRAGTVQEEPGCW